MTTYGVGILRDVKMGPPIVEYLERIDATLAPFDGHFVIHGGGNEMLEGTSPGTLIVIEFPDRAAAEGWLRASSSAATAAEAARGSRPSWSTAAAAPSWRVWAMAPAGSRAGCQGSARDRRTG